MNRTDVFIGLTMVAAVGGVVTAAALRNPLIVGLTVWSILSAQVAYALLARHTLLRWLVVMGVVTGLLELWADWVHVVHVGSIAYEDYFFLRVLASPSYMPAGWALTTVQFGYIALRLQPRLGGILAAGLAGLVGAGIPPLYEELAAPAGAWHYIGSPRVPILGHHCPWWIVGTYATCITLMAAVALLCYKKRAWARAVMAGIYAGGAIVLSGLIWYSLIG